ncbi:MAG: hypothetical protein K0Q72_5202, partial [Armatimonadetes bacterium]|nr:hypothetical protein [Armatimonadota bacterium]
ASGSSDRTIKLWDTETGEQPASIDAHKKPVFCLAFSPDGKWLASGSQDQSVKLWDGVKGSGVRTIAAGQTVTSLSFSKDGALLAAGCWDGTARTFNPVNGQLVKEFK